MKLYELSFALERLLADPAVLDPETGELTPDGEQQLDALQAELETKVLDIAAYIVGERTEAEAVEQQAKRLRERAARHERRAESLERYLARHLTPGSQRMADARVEIGWRRSTAVEVDESKLPAQWWREKVERVPAKAELSKALKAGETVDGAALVERWHLKVK